MYTGLTPCHYRSVPENLITDAQLRALLSGLVRNRSVTLLGG